MADIAFAYATSCRKETQMTSKEVQKELITFYRSKGITCKITVVPDGCWIYQGSENGVGKLFVGADEYTTEKDWFLKSYLPEVDNRLLNSIQ